jgi:hypothetical protein
MNFCEILGMTNTHIGGLWLTNVLVRLSAKTFGNSDHSVSGLLEFLNNLWENIISSIDSKSLQFTMAGKLTYAVEAVRIRVSTKESTNKPSITHHMFHDSKPESCSDVHPRSCCRSCLAVG